MNKTSINCTSIQEDIACNLILTDEQNKHLANCLSCQEVNHTMGQLNSILAKTNECQVPDDFLEKIMIDVSNIDEKRSKFYFIECINRFINSSLSRLALLWMGLAFGFSNLYRLIFGVLIPFFNN